MLSLFSDLFGQQDSSKQKLPSYIDLSYGFNQINLRDYATSPLIYSGSVSNLSLASMDRNEKRESTFRGAFSFGSIYSLFNDQFHSTQIRSIRLNYIELFRISKWSTKKLNFKVGGQIQTVTNIRINESLQNNALGFEIFANLSASGKLSYDVSRTKNKSKKFLFIKYNLKERHKTLDLTVSPGVVNSNLRNGFSYVGQDAILNQDGLFDQYQFNLFKGFRINTNLDYTFYLSNQNAFQFSYNWDFLKTGGNHDEFEMASHLFKFSLWYRIR